METENTDMENVDVVAVEEVGSNLPNPSGLTEQERVFCELYAAGAAPYAGNIVKCYEEAFNDEDPLCGMKANILLSKPSVQRYLSEISELSYDRTKHMKEFLNTTLMHIVDEMAFCDGPRDRKGNYLPASSCRGVAVSAAKMLMDLNGLKEGARDAELRIKNENGGNITFNVIVPNGGKTKEIEGSEV